MQKHLDREIHVSKGCWGEIYWGKKKLNLKQNGQQHSFSDVSMSHSSIEANAGDMLKQVTKHQSKLPKHFPGSNNGATKRGGGARPTF
jgi:hypothetical protein